MPIYEFYCVDCHTLFSFLSRRPSSRKRPACPACGRPRLQRKASAFAISSGRSEPVADPGGPDDARLEAAMGRLAHEAQQIDEDNPRQMASVMRKLFESTGLPVGEAMEQAIRRMEAGEDPDSIEAEIGPLLEAEDDLPPAAEPRLERLRRRLRPLRVDTTLYEL